MTTVQAFVDVQVLVPTAYNQWTQFESFPEFMEGVDEVRQETDTRTHWRTSIAGVAREFDAEVTEQQPDMRIAWQTVDGPFQAGVVTVHRVSDTTTRVALMMDYAPESMTEKAGTALGMVQRRAEGDLARFKEFVEARGEATGAWRGQVTRAVQRGE